MPKTQFLYGTLFQFFETTIHMCKEEMTPSHKKRATTNISELASMPWGKIKGQGVATLSN